MQNLLQDVVVKRSVHIASLHDSSALFGRLLLTFSLAAP